MSIEVEAGPVRKARPVPMRRALRRLMDDPAGGLWEFAQEAGERSSGWSWDPSAPTW
nr:hypothetical protein GCM10020093_002940 [Planobispora longispora]